MRPKKLRHIRFDPRVTYFKPRGVRMAQLSEVNLNREELEAIKLCDLEGLGQIESAKKLQISQSTFFRILRSARKKIAQALINGEAIRVKGGKFIMNKRKFRCEDCKNEWEEERGTGKRGMDMKCPKCGSENCHRVDQSGYGEGRQPWGKKGK